MRRNIYILLAAALASFAVFAALTGCVRDEILGVSGTIPGDGSATLDITLPFPVAKSLGATRAGVSDFNALDDLNIAVAQNGDDGTTISTVIYVSGIGTEGDVDEVVIATKGSGEVTYRKSGDSRGIHFSKEVFEYLGIDPATAVFLLVGNYGKAIELDTDALDLPDDNLIATVSELRSLKDAPYFQGANIGAGHMMYGESEPLEGNHGHVDGRSLKVEMKRTAAMITVKIDGTGLNNNIEIIPQSISLHNVPTWCYLGLPNDIDKVTPRSEDRPAAGNNPDMALAGESFSGALLNWGSLGTMPTGTSGLGNPVSGVVGGHYTTDADNKTIEHPAAPNYARDDIHPLFMFENIHGTDFGADNAANGPAGNGTGRGKRPWYVTWSAPETAQNETALMAAANALACSYLEVKAEYYRYNGTQVVEGGQITYRVFLGGNIHEDFDVERNTYYRFTLRLSGGAISESDFSWRLDTDLSETSALDESEFILNGAGEMVIISELIAKGDNSNWSILYTGDNHGEVNRNDPYLWMVTGQSNNNSSWGVLPLFSGELNPKKLYTQIPGEDESMQFRLFVDPMTVNDGAGDNLGYSRKVTFTLTRGDYTSDAITITQYAPVVIELDPANTTPDIKDQIAAAGKDPNQTMTIYFDRVDREAMPWGFSGEAITNAGSGYANGLNLLGIEYEPVIAANYMPFGKPSAMMHAAFINYYQLFLYSGFTTYNALGPAPTPYTIRFYSDEAYVVEDPIVPNSIPSREEWKLLRMLDEAGYGVFDEVHNHRITLWQNYWTSDAVEDDNTRSYVYRENATATDGIATAPRATPTLYRMIYIDQ